VRVITFDHQLLVNRDLRELARFRSYVLSIGKGEYSEATVAQEHNDSCCRKEPWITTAAAIVLAIDAPTPTIMVNVHD
jgi:hypothetical protein